MKLLRCGDLCHCCGQPIKTNNPDVLRLLTWIAQNRRLPIVDEITDILDEKGGAE